MSRRYRDTGSDGSVLSLENPNLFGVPLGDALGIAGGLALADYTAKRIIMPIVGPYLPRLGTSTDDTLGQLISAGATAFAGWLGGFAIGTMNKRIAAQVRFGGVIFAAAKALGAFVPGYSIDSSFPDFLAGVQLPMALLAPSNQSIPAAAPQGAVVAGSMGL